MPFQHLTLNLERPKHYVFDWETKQYPKCPKTLGEHLRKYRVDHSLRQIDVARMLNTCLTTIANWEQNRRIKVDHRLEDHLKELIGLPAWKKPKTLAEHIKQRRLKLRLTQKQVAAFFGITESKMKWWEYGATFPSRRLPRLIEFLGYDPRERGVKSVNFKNGRLSYR